LWDSSENKYNAMEKNSDNNELLSNYCESRTVFLVTLIMVLLAIVMLLVPGQSIHTSWASLGLLVMLLLWLGLSSLSVLCMLTPLLKKLSLIGSTITAFIIIQLMTLVVSEVAYQLTLYYVSLWPVRPDNHSLFLLRNVATSMIISGAALQYMYLQRQLQRKTATENQARILALQARIHPHFLFNSMNTIAALLHEDADAAEKAVVSLSVMYRAALASGMELVSLKSEIELTKHYLSVESLRLHDRLKVDWQIDAHALTSKIPGLTIQPLVENAVYHGIEPRVDGGEIQIRVEVAKKVLITIRNPLPSKDEVTPQSGNQLAMKNIQERMSISFGKHASLRSFHEEGCYRVELEFPRTTDTDEDLA